MALREELKKQGDLLFRWRGYLPLLMIVFFLLVVRDFHYPRGSHVLNRGWEVICFFVALFGLTMRAIASSSAPRGTSGRNVSEQRARSLNTTGMYSVTRNPLYLGNFLIWAGVILLFRSFWFSCVAVLIFWIYYERIIFTEEEYLRAEFGETFLEWTGRTPVFFPDFRKWKSPVLPFSWRNALRREYSGFFAIISGFTALDLVTKTVVEKKLTVDSLWIGLFAFGLAAYLTLLYLKKNTSVLDLKGR